MLSQFCASVTEFFQDLRAYAGKLTVLKLTINTLSIKGGGGGTKGSSDFNSEIPILLQQDGLKTFI